MPSQSRPWIYAAGAGAVLAAAAMAWWAWGPVARTKGLAAPPVSGPAASPMTAASAARAAAAAVLPGSAARAPAAASFGASGGAAVPALGPQAIAALQDFQRLSNLPAGEASIELTRQLEAGISADNMAGYVEALLHTKHPAVERAAISALGRAADSAAIQALAAAYGSIPAEDRGRILQVLESSANPAALPGLLSVAQADSGEKRSPLAVSALQGMANLGTMEGVDQLLRLVGMPAHEDFALLALERVRTQQGVAMIRAAAQGAKGSEAIPAALRPALVRIASAAEAAGPR